MFFVTFRLADSLPQKIVQQLKESIDPKKAEDANLSYDPSDEIRNHRIREFYFQRYEHQLDAQPYGECHLKNPLIAHIVIDKLHELDKKYYNLIA